MAQYRCDQCGATFDTRSEFLRHMKTSHPERAPSAADLESALSGIEFPAHPHTLARHARDEGEAQIADILNDLDDREYRDAADVARAFGEIRAHEDKPTYQPSVRGGAAAMETDAISAARIASLFEGMEFPGSADDLERHARAQQASEDEIKIVSNLPDRRYRDMSDVATAFGEVKDGDSQ